MNDHEKRVQYVMEQIVEIKNNLARDMLLSNTQAIVIVMDACVKYAGTVLASIKSRLI